MIDFSSTFKISMRSLKVNKMRSVLTSLGIIIGVAAVIIMLSIGEGAKQRITKDIESMGSNILMVMSGSTTSGGVRMGSGSQPTLTLKDAEAIVKNCSTNREWSTADNIFQPELVNFGLWYNTRVYASTALGS